MDGDKRKRKTMENVVAEEEETEEEKMENFYALIRSTKDLRDRMAGKLAPPQENNNKDKAPPPPPQPQPPVGVWNPSFRAEDFVEEYTQPLNIVSEATTGPSASKDKQEENNNNNSNVSKEGPDSEYEDYDHRHNLDLNLSL